MNSAKGVSRLSRSRRIFHGLQLRLRQYAHRSRSRHALHWKLHQRTRHRRQRVVGSAEEEASQFGGRRPDQTGRHRSAAPGASPHNLLSDTLGDELKLATSGKARVFAISLKDRAAVCPQDFPPTAPTGSIRKTGDWITSTYYRPDLPEWVRKFNCSHRTDKYLESRMEGQLTATVLGSTAPRNGKDASRRLLRSGRLDSFCQRIPIGICQGTRAV